jgi:hypothetical protein
VGERLYLTPDTLPEDTSDLVLDRLNAAIARPG